MMDTAASSDNFVAGGEIKIAEGSLTAPTNSRKPLARAYDIKLCLQDWWFVMKYDRLNI